MDYCKEQKQKQEQEQQQTINAQLLEANIKQIEIIEYLSTNISQLEEYNKVLEEKIADLETQRFLSKEIVDNVNIAVESSAKNIVDNEQKTILHIDDDRNILDIVRLMLRDYNYRVINDTMGTNAINLALKNSPDLIILDIMMPDMNGYDLLPQFRDNPVTKNIPILILSVSSNKSKSLELGATLHLTKPINQEELIIAISELIHTTS